MDYIQKDFNPDDLIHVIQRVLERRTLLTRQEQQNFEASSEQKKHVLIGESPAIREVRRLIDKFRESPANVLITGETGCGKEVVATTLARIRTRWLAHAFRRRGFFDHSKHDR